MLNNMNKKGFLRARKTQLVQRELGINGSDASLYKDCRRRPHVKLMMTWRDTLVVMPEPLE